MTEQNSRILNRVRKMMRLAQDAGASEGERDNALRMVQATLAKYNLDMDDVDQHAQTESRMRHSVDFLGKPWALRIAAAVGKLYFCTYFYQTLGGNKGPTQKARHVFIGRASNVITAAEMAQFVVEAVNREAQRYSRQIGGGYPDYRAFAQGAALRIADRVSKLIAESSTKGVMDTNEAGQSTGTALVLAGLYKREEDENKNWLVAQNVQLGKGRRESLASNMDARIAGSQYGARVSLNPQVK